MEKNENSSAFEQLDKQHSKNSSVMFNLLFLGGLLAVVTVFFLVFGGEENSDYSGLNGLDTHTFLSGEYTEHLSQKFTAKSEFKNVVTFAKESVSFCYGFGNRIHPLSSGNFTANNTSVFRPENTGGSRNSSANNHVEKIVTTSAGKKPAQTTTAKKTEKSVTSQEEDTTVTTTQTALTTPTEPPQTYWWDIPETTTGQRDVTVTMPPATNNNPPA